MPFFTPDDETDAITAMLAHAGLGDHALQGLLSGIKRRARARAVIAFVQALDPPPPDATIATTRELMRRLFGRAVSVNDLHRHFATPGRKADDRADAVALAAWLDAHCDRLVDQADQQILELELAWKRFTQDAAEEAGRLRKAETRRLREADRQA